MVAPDVQIEDGKGTILISSEEGETEGKRMGQKKKNRGYGEIVMVKEADRMEKVRDANETWWIGDLGRMKMIKVQ